jgi:hypothetical protein
MLLACLSKRFFLILAFSRGRIEELMSECVQYSESIVKLDDAAQAWRGREADVEAAADGLRQGLAYRSLNVCS